MGTFSYSIELGDPSGQRFERVEALIDTGTSYSVAPASVLHRLGVQPHDPVVFILGDGRRVERHIGRTWVRVNGKLEITIVVFGDEDGGALLGAYTLEGLRLGVDPGNRTLTPTPGLLLVDRRAPFP